MPILGDQTKMHLEELLLVLSLWDEEVQGYIDGFHDQKDVLDS